MSPCQIIGLTHLATQHLPVEWSESRRMKFYLSLVMKLSVRTIVAECLLTIATRKELPGRTR